MLQATRRVFCTLSSKLCHEMSWSGVSRIHQGFRMLHGFSIIFMLHVARRGWFPSLTLGSSPPKSFASKRMGRDPLEVRKRKERSWRFFYCADLLVSHLPDQESRILTPQTSGGHLWNLNETPGPTINTYEYRFIHTMPSFFWEGPMVQWSNCSLADSSGIFRQGRQRRKALPDKSFVGFVKQKSWANRCGCSVTSPPLFLWKRVVKCWTFFFQEKLGQFLMWRTCFLVFSCLKFLTLFYSLIVVIEWIFRTFYKKWSEVAAFLFWDNL